MSPSDEHLTQSFSDAPEPRVKKLSGAQPEGIAAIPHVESYQSSFQEVYNSIKRRREDGDTGGTAAKRPRNQTQLWVHITYDKQRKISLWYMPSGNTHDILIRALQRPGATATTGYRTALDYTKAFPEIESEDKGIKNEKSEDEGIKNEKSEDEGIEIEKSQDRNQTLPWVCINYDKQRKISCWIVPLGNSHDFLMHKLKRSGGKATTGYGNVLDQVKAFREVESEDKGIKNEKSEDEGIKNEKSQDRNENGNEAEENES